jgi:hypothetical protein
MSEKRLTRSLSKGKVKGQVNSVDKRDKDLLVSFIEPSNSGATESSFGIAPFPDSDEEQGISDEEQELPGTPRTSSYGSDSSNSGTRSRGRISVSVYRQTKIKSTTSENNTNNSNNNESVGSQSPVNSNSYNSTSEFGGESFGEDNNESKQLATASESQEIPKLTRSLSEFSK